MHSLEHIWRTKIHPELVAEKSRAVATGSYFDDRYVQSSITFESAPRVLFSADFYSQLPTLSVTPAEQQVMDEVAHENVQIDSKFYNGEHIAITDVAYDEKSNTIYIDAKRVNYAFICALANHRFAADSVLYQQDFYKAGVLAPCITTDAHTFFVKRTADELYSAPAGFLQPIDGCLNFDETDLVVQTAQRELLEEFFGVVSQQGDQEILKPKITLSTPQITSISFRRGSSRFGIIEFIAPCRIDCDKDYAVEAINNNMAKDAHEHYQDYLLLPLEKQHHAAAIEILSMGVAAFNGGFLYHPMLYDVYRLINGQITEEHWLADSWHRCLQVKSIINTGDKV